MDVVYTVCYGGNLLEADICNKRTVTINCGPYKMLYMHGL